MQSLENLPKDFPQHTALVDQAKTYYNNKYWFQFGEALLELTSFDEVKESEHVLRIFESIFDNPNVNLDPIVNSRIANRASDKIPTLEGKLEFFEKILEFTKDKKASVLLRCHKALALIIFDEKAKAKEILNQVELEIAPLYNVDKVIYSSFFKSMALYYLKGGDYQNFYKNSLQYLAYINENEINEAEKEDISVNMAIAILVSPNIFNFSELLELAVFQSLKTNTRFTWIYTLMETFNRGDLNKFNEDMRTFEQQIQENPAISNKRAILEDKIKIMAFSELVFYLPKNERIVSFQRISEVTSIPQNMIELMIIKAMSLGLLKGSIDEVEQNVSVTWIQPRVLNKERISKMKLKFSDWQVGLKELLGFVNESNSNL